VVYLERLPGNNVVLRIIRRWMSSSRYESDICEGDQQKIPRILFATNEYGLLGDGAGLHDIDPFGFHITNAADVFLESVPSAVLNIVNMIVLYGDHGLQPRNIVSLGFSLYLMYRHMYKYGRWIWWHKLHFRHWPMPGEPEDLQGLEPGHDIAMAFCDLFLAAVHHYGS